MGDAPAALNINFGAASGANQLIWDASHGMNGTGLYNVLNFEPGLDTLEFGQHGADGGFHNPAKLSRITDQRRRVLGVEPGRRHSVVERDSHAQSDPTIRVGKSSSTTRVCPSRPRWRLAR